MLEGRRRCPRSSGSLSGDASTWSSQKQGKLVDDVRKYAEAVLCPGELCSACLQLRAKYARAGGALQTVPTPAAAGRVT